MAVDGVDVAPGVVDVGVAVGAVVGVEAGAGSGVAVGLVAGVEAGVGLGLVVGAGAGVEAGAGLDPVVGAAAGLEAGAVADGVVGLAEVVGVSVGVWLVDGWVVGNGSAVCKGRMGGGASRGTLAID